MIKLQEKNFFSAYHSSLADAVKSGEDKKQPRIRVCRFTAFGGYFVTMNICDAVYCLSSNREEQRRFGKIETISSLLLKNNITVFTVCDLGWVSK